MHRPVFCELHELMIELTSSITEAARGDFPRCRINLLYLL
jgi:hypothetical protein